MHRDDKSNLDSINIQYPFTLALYKKAFYVHLRSRKGYKLITLALWGFAVFEIYKALPSFLALFLLIFGESNGPEATTGANTGCSFFCVLLQLFWHLFPASLAVGWKALIWFFAMRQAKRNPCLDQTSTIILNEEKIFVESKGVSQGEVHWSAITKATHGPEMFLLYLGPAQFIILPHGAIGTHEKWERLKEMIASKITKIDKSY